MYQEKPMSRTAWLTILAGACLCTAILIGLWPSAKADSYQSSQTMSAQYTRACVFATGGWTEVDCSAGAASSAQLNAWSRYVLQPTANVYFAAGTAATGQDADANDGYLPAGSWVEMLTSDTIRYYSCHGSATSGKVRHIECR